MRAGRSPLALTPRLSAGLRRPLRRTSSRPSRGSGSASTRRGGTTPTPARSAVSLVQDIFPWLGGRPVGEIKAPELLAALRRIESRGRIESAHRALRDCGRVFAYAISTGRAERNPAADLRGALTPPVKVTHHAALTDPKAIGGLLRAIDGYRGTPEVRCALRLAPLTFTRPGELRAAEWREIDLDQAEWNIPAERMKTRESHLVPLSRQAVECLRGLHAVTGTRRYVFGVARPMSENTINCALRRLGYATDQMTGHGFRAMARTILDEVLGVRPDFIEHQLAHAVRDPLGRAYNRTTHLPERRRMMQPWADYLDGLKNGAEVVPLRSRCSAGIALLSGAADVVSFSCHESDA